MKDPDPVNRESAQVQAVATVAAPSDLAAFGSSFGTPFADTFVGAVHVSASGRPHSEGSAEWQLFHDASPISWVSSGDAPTLLIHGDKDPVVPVAQAETMFKALRAASVEAEVVHMPNGGHVWAADWAGFPGVISRWLDRHLRIAEQAGK